MVNESGLIPPEPSEDSRSLYVGTDHQSLIARYYETEGDPNIARELSIRILEHAGITDNPETIPLVGRDGTQIKDQDRAFTLADYVYYAANHHFAALEGILAFLLMNPGEEDYESTRLAMLARLKPGEQ